MAIQDVFVGTVAWHSDIDPGPSKILAHHWPDVPNLGDITATDFTQVEQVDIICGGSPCQDLSHAGARAGMRDGTRSGLWSAMCQAIETIRPTLVVWENVLGALSAGADSDMGPCDLGLGCEGPVSLRALGRVLGDLTELGYDAAWTTLAASDIGAPHRRERVFALAWPADVDEPGLQGPYDPPRTAPTQRRGHALAGAGRPDLNLFRTPNARDGEPRGTQHPAKRLAGGHQPSLADQVEHLLPTPAVNDMGAGKTVDAWDAWTDRMKAAHGNGNGHGASLSIEALRMLPTPRATDGTKGGPNQRGSSGDLMLPSAVQLMPTPSVADVEGGRKTRSGARNDELLLNGLAAEQRFGDYAPAIARWEHVLGRPAPAPTEANFEQWERRKAARLNSPLPAGRRGSIRFIVDGPPHRLSPAFVEWMMGLPAGHVTGVPDLSRNAQLKALGNGVVWQQCAAATRALLADLQEANERGVA